MPPGLRERKKAQTREAIVTVALDLFERDGYDATTIEDITRAAEVSSRTLFRYFDSKFAIAFPGDEQGKSDRIVDMVTARPASESPVEATLQVMRLVLVAMLESDDQLVLRRLRFVMSEPDLRAQAANRFRAGRGGIVRAFAARLGVDEDDLAARVLGGVFAETIWAVVEEWVRSGAEPEALDALATEAFDHLRRGVTPA